jgi:Flp pilus assembly protein TadG
MRRLLTDYSTIGFLCRLRQDRRGNTLAIVAAALVPLAGMIGGGMDMSRLYMTKTRLQHACDAAALAGRKQMGGGAWNAKSLATANEFFGANFANGSYGSTDLQESFTENAGVVTGSVSVVLPMTLMRILGKDTVTVPVTCNVDMRIPNTDVMFVLDTTGSMSQPAAPTDADTKIVALRRAVKCFYEELAKLDTTENCATGTPSGGTSSAVQVRFGFMPYATNVNVGKLLPTAYFADNWSYQTRKANWTTTTNTTYPTYYDSAGPSGSDNGNWSSWTNVSSGFSSCPSQPANTSVNGPTTVDSTPALDNGNMVYTTTSHSGGIDTQYQQAWSGWYCYLQKRTRIAPGSYTTVIHTAPPVTQTTQHFQNWTYDYLSQPISGLKNGASWNGGLTLPVGNDGTAKYLAWDGCIEERQTVKQSSYSPIPSGAKDLDIDLIPDQSDMSTLWAPALPGLIWTRQSTISNSQSQWDTASVTTTTNYRQSAAYYCPTEAKKLQEWPNPAQFETYVNSLRPQGTTYHDIGLLWGARFISPTGIFASENAQTPTGGKIERNIIFMTDGDTNAVNNDYAAYGLSWFDRRQTSSSAVPSASALNAQVNARFNALCDAVKNKNITLWVISFGTGSNASTESRLSTCSTPGRYFVARNAATLQQTFAQIANQISQLRLTQ